jgi:Heterokaryon incompatibility protein (HET)
VSVKTYDALEQLRFSRYQEHIWIDALCIDQNDKSECSAQVLLIGTIYASAAEVIVWLGKDIRFLSDVIWLHNQTALQSQAWQHLREMNLSGAQRVLFPINKQNPAAQELLAKWQGYWQFFECRTWFTRAWIVQEVILARHIVMWCGEYQLPYDKVVMLVRLLGLSGTIGLINRYADTARGEASPNLMFRLGGYRDMCQDGLPGNNSVVNGTVTSQQGVEALNFHAYAFNLTNLVRTHRATNVKDKVYCRAKRTAALMDRN